MTARYAVLLKIHYWDGFAERRLQHLLSKVGTGDVHIFVDETHGTVGEIPHNHVTRATERDMTELGVVLQPPGQVFWYSVDYPLYYFYLQNPSYDYYLMCEHDAVLNIEVDEFIGKADRERVDYVGFPLTRGSWPLRTCEGVYPKTFKLYQWLSCISLYSKRSVDFLLARRRVLARLHSAGTISSWPNNEVFIPTEMHNNGFHVRELRYFGNTERYDWWPPSHEDDLPALQDQAFLHPVLDERRYVVSCVQRSDLRSYLYPESQLRQLLGGRSSASLVPIFLDEFMRRFIRQVTPIALLNFTRLLRAQKTGIVQRLLRRLTQVS
jgi:hypothetical protein